MTKFKKGVFPPKFRKALINLIRTLVIAVLGDIVLLLIKSYLTKRFKLLPL
ncbi:hypothetical protein J6TS1_08700 [Siminovitchia terrae]|uniref:Uncharacterized protein n=1 Tax=Siminovitchia terrae TaxID=1914933 RepID=A0ABQ4KSM7_SIMTE|nr:hypothetical protein J22TS1_21250 [Siminovitchia terrae]GIN95000.1 hypothetical protein J6TS1_08700 [Siminovitchia terrae]